MRASLCLIAIGLGGNALLLIAQTVLHAPPSLRVGFLLMDALLLAGFAREGARRFSTATALSACALVLDVIALVSRGEARVLSPTEQVLGLGLAFATTSFLGRVIAERTQALKVLSAVAYTLATMALLLKLSRIWDSGTRGLVTSWISWSIEVSRPIVNAVIALVAARSLRQADAGTAAGDGPYRTPGAAGVSLRTTRPEKAPLPIAPFVLQRLASGERGLRLYSLAFTIRFLSGAAMTALFIAAVMFMRGPDEVGTFFVLQPLVGAVSGVLLVVGLVRAGPVFDVGHASSTGAMTCLIMATIGDVLTLLVGLAALAGESSYRAARTASEILFLEVPGTGLLGAIALVLVLSAFKKVGRALDEPAVVHRATSIQALMMMATVGVCAILWTLLTTGRGETVIAVELVIVLVLLTAIGFVHISLISMVRNAVKKRMAAS